MRNLLHRSLQNEPVATLLGSNVSVTLGELFEVMQAVGDHMEGQFLLQKIGGQQQPGGPIILGNPGGRPS